MHTRRFLSGVFVLLILVHFALLSGEAKPQSEKSAREKPVIKPSLFTHLEWRNIGPSFMCGRVTDVEGVPGKPNVVYIGSASGGLWKTLNGGTTWKPLFDKQSVLSIGDIALEPGNPDVIYVGTGESNTRNSISFGNGIYKSTDGGESWKHLGLEETERISRIVVHPKNPNVVYVGALGHAFGPNEERGVFMTSDGGESWEKVLHIDEHHGVSDLDIDPQNPNILYAAFWRFERKPWTFTSGSEKGGVFRSIDGGRTWKRLNKGLPKLMGRIGVKVARSDPRIVYVMAESHEGTLYRSDDRGQEFHMVSKERKIVSRGFYYTDLRVDPSDENRVYAIASRLFVSIDGGKNFKRISSTTHSDYHALWIDPQNPNLMWQGQDGGVAVSYDRGESWEYINNFALGQFYQIYADNREPFYFVGGGLQDNGTWYGPSHSREPFGILNDEWRMISFGDGFYIVVHPENHEIFISESQGGRIVRTNMETREQQNVSPQARGADGGPASLLKFRFNWNAPIIASPHDPKTVYVGGNVVFKSADFGSTWQVISPDLTTNDPEKQKTAGGPAWTENTTAEFHCTIISLAESPLQPGMLWAGTDDGNLQLSQDKGKTWNNVIKNVPGIPAHSPVSHIEPSRATASRAYCSFDRHMLDDFRPYIYKTNDFGKTWENITGDLPKKAYVWVVREDPKKPDILYAGTELGFYVSFRAGKQWIKLGMKNLPAVSVHDILIHPRENDLILGTHGRGIWIFDDITFLQEISQDKLQEAAYLFSIRPALRFLERSTRYGIGDKPFKAPNPPYGALITYYLKDKPDKETKMKMEILDKTEKVIREIKDLPHEKGLNRVAWDLRHQKPRPRREKKEEEDFFFERQRGPLVLPETYIVRLTLDDKQYEKPVVVRLDPTLEVSFDELVVQSKCALELTDMQSYVNDGLRALDMLKDQIQERKNTLKKNEEKFPQEVIKVIEDHLEKIDSIQNLLTRPEGRTSLSEESRLVERLRSLFGNIDGVHAAPTQAQIAYFNELKEEFKKVLADVNEYLAESAVELNKKLSEYGVPVLILPQPVKLEDK